MKNESVTLNMATFLHWVFGFCHQDAKILLKQEKLVKLVITTAADTDLSGTQANPT